jgi:hypothetical protein
LAILAGSYISYHKIRVSKVKSNDKWKTVTDL